MREHRAKSGRLIYYATRHELEGLPGYRGNDRRGRACCPIHAGDNPTALAINWETGWASCFSCGDDFSIRIEDHPDAPQRGAYDAPRSPRIAATRPKGLHHDQAPETPPAGIQAALAAAIAAAAERLPASPGAAYLAARGIPLDVAQSLRLGWGTTGKLASRVIFPLCGPDGQPTSAMGRAIDDRMKPKYDTLKRDDGYQKTLFNGAAIAQAKRAGTPLVIVEGPIDAAACVAAGIPYTVAICGKSYAHPEHFAGLDTVILALDADDAGQTGRRALWLDLTARGIEVLMLPPAALKGCKDLGEYWQQHRAMPVQLAARVIGPYMPVPTNQRMHNEFAHRQAPTQRPASPQAVPESPDIFGYAKAWAAPDDERRVLTIAELKQRTAEYRRSLTLTPDDLPADLKTEAEALAIELASDLDALGEVFGFLLTRSSTLAAEDRCAGMYALQLAIAALPDAAGEVA